MTPYRSGVDDLLSSLLDRNKEFVRLFFLEVFLKLWEILKLHESERLMEKDILLAPSWIIDEFIGSKRL